MKRGDSMGVRRVVTGHTSEGVAVVVSDEDVALMAIGDRGSATWALWSRDDAGQFPDDGSQPPMSAAMPPVGGNILAVVELAPEGDEFHEYVRDALAPWADPNEPGMHRTATMDYDIVLEGSVGLELDNGAEVLLGPGDIVVQNGTRHRWHNRGDKVARVVSVTLGAHQRVEGGRPV